jgi:hypothetical protein
MAEAIRRSLINNLLVVILVMKASPKGWPFLMPLLRECGRAGDVFLNLARNCCSGTYAAVSARFLCKKKGAENEENSNGCSFCCGSFSFRRFSLGSFRHGHSVKPDGDGR